MQNGPDVIKARKVHLIFKTHLDVGYTDLGRNVITRYFNDFFPSAIKLAATLREQDCSERFVWTTGSWLIYEYLEQASTANRRMFEEAIVRGDINWHAMPFTVHCELMDMGLFEFGLSISAELDKRFGHRTIAAKMSDIPGHTRAIVPSMAKFGVKFLHIGTNGVSRPPDVPRAFLWKHHNSEILVVYDFGFYGRTFEIDGLPDVLSFAHTLDNRPPHDIDQVRAVYKELHRQFANTEIVASSLDAFAESLITVKDKLPVITGEIGDTWIHGTATDPHKVALFRCAQRMRAKWLRTYKTTENRAALAGFSRKLLMVPEHTWGLSSVKNADDYKNYSRSDFQKLHASGYFDKYEQTWAEQRQYLNDAAGYLRDTPMFDELQAEWKKLEPAEAGIRGYDELQAGQEINTGLFTLKFDNHGAVRQLKTADRRVLASGECSFAQFSYEKFSQNDYDRFVRQYLINMDTHARWGLPAFTRPGIAPWAGKHKRYLPKLTWLGVRENKDSCNFRVKMAMPPEAAEHYGSPRRLCLDIAVHKKKAVLKFTLQWFDKAANRMPEALWFSFLPMHAESGSWQLTKMGEAISPAAVVKNGSRHLHCVENVEFRRSKTLLRITNPDTPLAAIGSRCLLNFRSKSKSTFRGVHFNLYNNIWNTNFPRWYSQDGISRFLVEIF